MLNVVIFSKDRACQLDLLLRSADLLVDGWRTVKPAVLFAASSQPHEEGYARLARLHPHVCLVRESRDFKADTLALVDERLPGTMFLVDDDVFVRPFAIAGDDVRRFLLDPRVLALSLRLWPGIAYCYARDRWIEPPALADDLTWRWREHAGDWGYPMSLDGNVYRTPEIASALARATFANPNTLEQALSESPLPHALLSCVAESRVVGIPANRVQEVAANRHMGGSAESLNERFLDGDRLALEPLLGLRPQSVHHALEYAWVRSHEDAAAA